MKNIIFILIVVALITVGCSLDEITPNSKPSISDVTISPDSISITDIVSISAIITDTDGTIEDVNLNYGENNTDISIEMVLGNADTYSAEIGPFTDGITISYQIIATDDAEEETISSSSFTIGSTQPEGQSLYINEYLASNDAANEDEFGGFDDWIEIYNASDVAINIAGMYISDSLTDIIKYQIADTDANLTTIQPGGFLVIWADDEVDQGILHTNFKLSSGGESIVLTDTDGTTIIESRVYEGQTTDYSEGRSPDGTDNWIIFETPTPGATNQ
ncbi:MAG: lamin tail domain-containing protein [Candidatus Cloacimonadota bacterium]|nr:lamin tail domain-containing protein [Candidatus Cloacimonadota bacterium]